MTRRGHNAHLGEMIQFFLPWDCHAALERVKNSSGRFGIDVLRLAAQHCLFYPRLYSHLSYDKDGSRHRTDVRVSLALRDVLGDMAWRSGLPRNHWLSALLVRFFAVTDVGAVERVLAEGQDVQYQMTEDFHGKPTGDGLPWYAPLPGSLAAAHRGH